MQKAEAEVETEIGELADLDLFTLRERWREFYESEPPIRMSPELMLRAIAYRIQEEAFGGLSRSVKARLSSTTKLADTTSRSGNRSRCGSANSPSPIRRDHRVKPGTKFLREWNGRMIEVIAMADGRYVYRGEAYRSLSAIARRITGTRWSGLAFFGIGAKPGGRRGEE